MRAGMGGDCTHVVAEREEFKIVVGQVLITMCTLALNLVDKIMNYVEYEEVHSNQRVLIVVLHV
jgi:hypothetical protein